jgi:hypothetical protein
MNPEKFAKAIVGALIAAVAALVPVAGDGVSLVDALITAGAVLVGFQAVYWTKNAE